MFVCKHFMSSVGNGVLDDLKSGDRISFFMNPGTRGPFGLTHGADYNVEDVPVRLFQKFT